MIYGFIREGQASLVLQDKKPDLAHRRLGQTSPLKRVENYEVHHALILGVVEGVFDIRVFTYKWLGVLCTWGRGASRCGWFPLF